MMRGREKTGRERRGRERVEGGKFLVRDRLREGSENEGGRDGGREGREAREGGCWEGGNK